MKLAEIIPVGSQLGECPVWDAELGVLYWTDIPSRAVGKLDVRSGRWQMIGTGCRVGSFALTNIPDTIVAATDIGIVILDISADPAAEVAHLHNPEEGIEGMRFNDGRTDRSGRFWAGSMDEDGTQSVGSMYRLDHDGSLQRQWTGIAVPNGLAFAPDNARMYTADSPTRSIMVASYDGRTGNAGGQSLFATVAGPGVPDGSTVDETGALWNAEWDNHALTRYSPAGKKLGRYSLPVIKPTCPAFGGTDMNLLFVTSAVTDLGRSIDGSILVYESNTTGLTETRYHI